MNWFKLADSIHTILTEDTPSEGVASVAIGLGAGTHVA